MTFFSSRAKKIFVLETALTSLVLHTPIYGADDPLLSSLSKKEKELEEKGVDHNLPSFQDKGLNKENYTINFNNISIVEYIRFVSKITNLNFVFNDEDMGFNVTIVSEDPVTPKNILSILIQVLRIHGLAVLEQENNLLITKATTVNQIATIVSEDVPDGQKNLVPVVTRVFRIKNANLNTLATIIRPMLSQTSLLEVSTETRQLIITDITTNVDKVSALLASIDAPHTSLEIDSYVAKNAVPQDLINLATQIIAPFAEGNPVIFVPQGGTRTIFIVSTPHLIERALIVLEDLDTPKAAEASGDQQNILLYKIQLATGHDLLKSLENLAKELKSRNGNQRIIEALSTAKYIKESNSILFVSDADTLTKVKDLVASLDSTVQAHAKSNFLVYKIQNAPAEQLQQSLDEMVQDISKAPYPDSAFIEAIHSMKYIKETNSLVFTGDEASLKKLSDILPTFDGAAANQFFIYNPQHRSGHELEKSIQDMATNFKASGLSDPGFLHTLTSIKWVPETNSLIFTGNAASLARVGEILKTIDTPYEGREVFLYKPKYITREELTHALSQLSQSLDAKNPSDASVQKAMRGAKWMDDSQSFLFRADPSTINRIKDLLGSVDTPGGFTGGGINTFYLYKLANAPGESVIANLHKVASDLQESKVPNAMLIQTLRSIKLIKENNSLLITGTSASIDQAKQLIEQFDVAGLHAAGSKSSFFIYKPSQQSASFIQSSLRKLGEDLQSSGLIDPDLLSTIATMRYVETTNSILFTGTPAALDKIKDLLTRIDSLTPDQAKIQKLGEITFFVYKIQYVPSQQLLTSLKEVALDLQGTGALDAEVAKTLHGMKWIKESNSIVFTGSPDTLQKVELLLQKFDNPSLSGRMEGGPLSNFVVYTPKNVPGDELIKILEDFEQNLLSAGVTDRGMYDSIKGLRWIPRTCSLLIPGDQPTILKIQDLLKQFDVPVKGGPIPSSIESIENTSFLIYKLQYHQGNEILSALKQISSEIIRTETNNNQNLVNAINSLQWVKVTNSLIATGQPEILAKIKELIANLDVPLKQIFIEVLVVETSLSNTHNFGLQWGGKMQYLNKFSLASGNFPLTPTSSTGSVGPGPILEPGINAVNASTPPTTSNVPFTNGFDLGIIGDIIMHKGKSFLSLGSLVNALELDTDSTVVFNPKIITQDSRTTTAFVGNNLPFIGSQVSTTSSITQTQANIEYRDIGFNLTLTPTVGNSDIITIDIITDISEVINNPTTQGVTGATTGIATSHTNFTTRVLVPDQHFVVLSGMLQDSKARFKSSVPCLGGIPLIGLAFTESDRLNAKNNIIMFIRPHIIKTFDQYKEETAHQENLYKDSAILPVLKEEFDQGVDLVKTPHNE
ncbi:MAG: hypothetical protein JSR58_00395 [Verrucomicrobia bacterium]|nr:hypothetical protein [Verrucomicrobiota bacterium]